MEKDRAKRFDEFTTQFAWGFQQDVFSYITHLEQQGFTVQDIKDFHEYRVKEAVRERAKTKKEIKRMEDAALKSGRALRCTECPGLMLLYEVNVDSTTQTEDDSKSVWMCQNQDCMHTIYNKEVPEEILKKKE